MHVSIDVFGFTTALSYPLQLISSTSLYLSPAESALTTLFLVVLALLAHFVNEQRRRHRRAVKITKASSFLLYMSFLYLRCLDSAADAAIVVCFYGALAALVLTPTVLRTLLVCN
jgi:hypothetical protein